MALKPQPVRFVEVIPEEDFDGPYGPKPLAHIGPIPGAYTGPDLETQAAPTIDPAPADADAVAADLQALVNALIATGLLTEP